MIKQIKRKKEITENHKYCDECGKEIEIGLACSKAQCEYCKKDLCEECIGYEEQTFGDYRIVYCEDCNKIRLKYKSKIDLLTNKIDELYEEQRKEAIKLRQLENKK